MESVEQHIDTSSISAFFRGLKPDPALTVSQWADAKRVLTVAAEPGPFRTSRTPYMREIMDRLSVRDKSQRIIFKKSSQVGATESGNNWLGYVIDAAPSPFLYMMPTDMMMKEVSKSRIQKMIDSSPDIRQKIRPSKAKESGNTIQNKEFEGGFVKMVGANSPVGLSSTAVRNVYADEIDRYPLDVGGEGSAIELANTRTATYGARKKMFLTSTPTRKGASAIDEAFEHTGQRFYQVPCPHCGGMQALFFEQLRYEVGKYGETKYECIHCQKLIEERYKTTMLANGLWVPLYPEREDGITYGYFINALYSPLGWYSWGQMAKEYVESENDMFKRITWVNTKAGEVYEEKGEKPNWEGLYDRAEDYKPNKPFKQVAVITAGADVQADRIEVEIVGWMPGKKSQSIDYRVLVGDTDKPEVWEQLAAIVNESWVREDNYVLPLRLLAVDSGYNTAKVYEFTKRFTMARVIPVKGSDRISTYYSAPKATQVTKAGKKINTQKVWSVGISFIKTELYGMLKLRIDTENNTVPEGYCYFPKRDPHYFRGITAEEIQTITNRRNYVEYVWVKKYERNEPLDCRVYARAAAAIVGIDRWNVDRWNRELFVGEQRVTSEKQKGEPKKKRSSNWW